MNTSRTQLKSLLCVAGGLALLAAPSLFAADNMPASKFKAYDTDNDGRISQAEYIAGCQQDSTRKLDANNDGTVSASEKSTATPEKKHWWSRSDNSAGDDTKADAKRFKKLDTNNDGYLSEAEFSAASDNMHK
ncbi:MAG TPA: EF-hand domain-containing protein [Lacunisphaera sp.]|nr:EF-hand domain-containing protein [Lacunisphaera sp.]